MGDIINLDADSSTDEFIIVVDAIVVNDVTGAFNVDDADGVNDTNTDLFINSSIKYKTADTDGKNRTAESEFIDEVTIKEPRVILTRSSDEHMRLEIQ